MEEGNLYVLKERPCLISSRVVLYWVLKRDEVWVANYKIVWCIQVYVSAVSRISYAATCNLGWRLYKAHTRTESFLRVEFRSHCCADLCRVGSEQGRGPHRLTSPANARGGRRGWGSIGWTATTHLRWWLVVCKVRFSNFRWAWCALLYIRNRCGRKHAQGLLTGIIC